MKAKQFQFRVDERYYRAVKKIADMSGISLSATLRELIEFSLFSLGVELKKEKKK